MKPLNAAETGCTPISSNCVIWQGPDIECIKLCKGDTVSAVVAKLATELCTIMDELKVTNYDLTCLNLSGCGPQTFQQLIQLLIDKVCALNTCCQQNTNNGTTREGCPDCIVDICKNFQYYNELGDLVTTMQLTDYVTAIGNRVCNIIDEIEIIKLQINNLDIRVTALENAPAPTFTIPQIIPTCVLPGVPTDINIVLAALEQQFCLLISATGTGPEILLSISNPCVASTTPTLNNSSVTMGSLPGWIEPVGTLADSINNLWITICDLRAAVLNIQTNCCPSGCDGIVLSMSVELDGTDLTVFVNGTIPAGFGMCPPSYLTPVKIQDAYGNYTIVYMNIITYLNAPLGYTIDLASSSLDVNTNLTVTVSPCLENGSTGAHCEYTLVENVTNSGLCPTMVYTNTDTTIDFSTTITVPGTTTTYTLELWDTTLSTLVNSTSVITTVPPAYNWTGSFGSLSPSTTYKLRVVIQTASGATTNCPFAVVITSPANCLPPDSVTPSITI
jgi:hypothetical protein